VSRYEYVSAVNCALDVLSGDIADAAKNLEKKMYEYSEAEQFEAAARCRDTIVSLEKLRDRQKAVTDPKAEHDIFALYRDEMCSVISVLIIRGGRITDNEQFTFSADEILEPENISSFIFGFYRRREYVPKDVLIGFDIPEEDAEDLRDSLSEMSKRKVRLHRPERGELKALCDMAYANAEQNATHYKKKTENENEALAGLAVLLGLEVYPERIEAYDISNIGREHKVAGMVVMENGVLKRSDYRSFKIKTVEGQDDYASMREAISRRLGHIGDESFPPPPDLILLDGGKGHVSVIRQLTEEMGCDIPVFGMVKDEYHKTRTLTDGESEISIAKKQSVFMMIYKLQEEVHRYTYSRMDSAKRKSLRTSSLEKIKGIGEKKAKILLKELGSLAAVRSADVASLSEVKGISARDAEEIYSYFNDKKGR